MKALNRLSRGEFTDYLSDVFEHSPWIPDVAYKRRPFRTMDELLADMTAVVMEADEKPQLALLRAHPELAGKEAQAGELTTASDGEQSSVGLNALSRQELQQAVDLNKTYKEKFGFPFIIAVRQNTKQTIFSEMRRRTENDLETERQTALEQVCEIARIRIGEMIRDEQ